MLQKVLFFIFAFFVGVTAFSSTVFAANFHSCTREHLEEAITLNNERKPLYAKLSDNKSLEISEALVKMEQDLLRMALLSDVVSYFYQKAGVPLLCDEYVSMKLTPAFAEKAAQPWPVLADFQLTDLPTKIASINEPLKKNDYVAVVAAAKAWLKELEKAPGFYCLERHFVESMGRAAALAPQQSKLAEEKLGIGSLWISNLFIKSHFDLMKTAQELDKKAAVLQSKGIAIICQDIPPIAIPDLN